MRILRCRRCLSFATDQVFASVRNKLTNNGVDWHLTPVKAGEYVEPQIDQMFYDKRGVEAVIDARGYLAEHIICEMTKTHANIRFTSEGPAGEMSMARGYTSNASWNVYFDESTADLCMSTENIVLFTVLWDKTK